MDGSSDVQHEVGSVDSTIAETIEEKPSHFTDEALHELYRALLFPRMIEDKMLKLLRQGRLSKWFSGIGQEAIAVGVACALRQDDYILPMHRNLGVFTTRKLDLVRLLCQLMGKGDGYSRGRERSFHFGTLAHHLVGMISHLGSMLPVADGLGLAFKLQGSDRVAVPFTGDGATSEGDFHEAVNLAAVWKLPVIFVIENNQYGLSTPVSEQYACQDLADKGVGYGIPAFVVDGNDVLAVFEAISKAAARARAGEGPTLLEFKTFRMRGHEEASGVAYVPKELFELWGKKDPIDRFERRMLAWGLLTPEERDRIRAEFKQQIDDAVDEALEAPAPDRSPEVELADVYAPSPAPVAPAVSAGQEEMRYLDAISDGLRVAMRKDPNVVILGQDIAEYGGAFKITQGFVEEFGKERIRNTPIIESGAIGCAMGLGFEGFKAVIEMQFADFVSCGFNQIINNLAKNHYRWGEPVPVVVRLPSGGGVGAGPFHSQNPESFFTHCPGLKVVAPSSPEDAKGLLLASIYDNNPVIFIEHKFLYRSIKGTVPQGFYTTELGKGKVVRTGEHATIVTYGVGVHWALEAAEALAGEGVSIEVIDLRTLIPWDQALVMESIRKTSRALVLHEATHTCGFGAEVAATISHQAFEWLDAPVFRVGSLDTPVPFSKVLEERFMARHRLMDNLRQLLSY